MSQADVQASIWRMPRGSHTPLLAAGLLTEITAESLVDGNEVSVFGGGFFETNYCSNNFKECRLWNGIDPASANSYSDQNIKQEYSAAQLLEYYRQGLELQSRLVELYRERQGEDGR